MALRHGTFPRIIEQAAKGYVTSKISYEDTVGQVKTYWFDVSLGLCSQYSECNILGIQVFSCN